MKLKIDNDALAEEFFEDTHLLGIVAPFKDYTFSWHLNQQLCFDFRMNAGLEIELDRRGRRYFFTVYDYNIPNTSLWHYLYNNQFDGEYLLPEFRHLDFLWLVKGDLMEQADLEALVNSVRAVNGVQLVTELSPEQIRNKGHLIF